MRSPTFIAWMLGVAAVAIYGHGFLVAPPLDGDAYEYAEIASNYLRHGELTQTHARYPALPDVTLPTPAGRRLNLYVLICLPFQALFGSSALVVVLPFLMVLLVLPRVALYALGSWLGVVPSLVAVSMLLFHPHFLEVFGHDPNVDLLVTLLLLLTLAAFRKRRFIGVGLWLGLAVLVKVNAIMMAPALLLALWVGERHRLRSVDTWKGVGVCTAVILPYTVHVVLYQLTGPGVAEAMGIGRIGVEHMQAGSLVDILFRNELPAQEVPKGFGDYGHILAINAWRYLMGSEWLFGDRLGALELLGLLVIPFAAVGFQSIKDRTDRWALAGFCVCFAFFHTVMILEGEARWFAAGYLVLWATGFAGLQRWLGERIGLRVGVAYMLMLTVPAMTVGTVGGVKDEDISTLHYENLRDLEEAVGHGEGLIFTNPFYSPSYFTGGNTVPVPMGSMDEVLQFAETWDAKGLLLFRHRDGACLPWDAALPPTVEMARFCYYRFTGSAASVRARASERLLAFAPLDYQLELIGPLVHTAEWSALTEAERVWPPVLLVLVLWLSLALARRRGVFIPWFGVTVVSSVGSFAIFVCIATSTPDEAPLATIEEQQLEAFLEGDASTLLQFESIAPDWDVCPPMDVRSQWNGCPAPISGFRCVPDANVLVEGCMSWSRGNPGPPADEASDITMLLEFKLAARAAERLKEGREVLRLPRAVVSRLAR